MVFGTSISLGAGVDEQDTYAAVLGRLLRSTLNEKVEIQNASLPAYPTGSRFNLAQKLTHRYRPDAVVMEIRGGSFYDAGVGADLSNIGLAGATPLPVSRVERYSFAATALYPPMSLRQRMAGLLQRNPRIAAAPQSTGLLESRIKELAALGQTEGFRLHLLFLRPMHSFDSPALDQQPREQLRAFAEELGIGVIDTYPLFDPGEFPDAYQVFPGDNHPNAPAHARFATAAAKVIGPDLVARFHAQAAAKVSTDLNPDTVPGEM
jgi:hypothetical protein